MTGRGAIALALGAALLGAISEVTIVVVALLDPPRMPGPSALFLIRGSVAWHGNERRSALLRWCNLESVAELVNPVPDSGEVPAWAEPGPPTKGGPVRTAALGVGWPMPALAWRWRTDRGDVNFPPPIEAETSGDSPKEAAKRVRAAIAGDVAPAGGHGEMKVLAGGLAADALVLGAPCFAVLAAIAGQRGRGSVIRPG